MSIVKSVILINYAVLTLFSTASATLEIGHLTGSVRLHLFLNCCSIVLMMTLILN